jgi:gluconolactonase
MIYFTDPTSGRSAEYGVPREPELPFSGVYKLNPITKELTLLVDDFTRPNGLCFSRDEKLLYVNDTRKFHIRVFAVREDGRLENGRIFAKTKGEGAGVPDGMKIDSAGNIYCCGPGGIHIFNSQGTTLGVILMPEPTANFCFGDRDMQSLYITASTSLYRIRVKLMGNTIFHRSNVK